MAAQGALQEQVYDVVRSSDRKPDAPGKLPSVGTTVGIENEEAMAGLAQAPSPPALSRIRDGHARCWNGHGGRGRARQYGPPAVGGWVHAQVENAVCMAYTLANHQCSQVLSIYASALSSAHHPSP